MGQRLVHSETSPSILPDSLWFLPDLRQGPDSLPGILPGLSGLRASFPEHWMGNNRFHSLLFLFTWLSSPNPPSVSFSPYPLSDPLCTHAHPPVPGLAPGRHALVFKKKPPDALQQRAPRASGSSSSQGDSLLSKIIREALLRFFWGAVTEARRSL